MSCTEAAVTFLGLGLGPETLLWTGVPLSSMEQLGWLLLSLQVGSVLLLESTDHAEGSSSRSRYRSPASSSWPPETRPQTLSGTEKEVTLCVGEMWHLRFRSFRSVNIFSCLLFHSCPPDMPQSILFCCCGPSVLSCIKWTVFTCLLFGL